MQGKKVGIWGYGIVGKSVLTFLQSSSHFTPTSLILLTNAPLEAREYAHLERHNVTVLVQSDDTIRTFLEQTDYIIASPGIDLRPYAAYNHKFIAELDLFYHAWRKPIIAITGTVGKTSVTHILSHLLTNYHYSVATGGNIGKGMLDLINDSPNADYAVLETSSFQLEYATACAPDYALILNLFPNHLDRHTTLADYYAAKSRIFMHQKSHQKIVIPFEALIHFEHLLHDRSFACFSPRPLTAAEQEQFKRYQARASLYFFDECHNIMHTTQHKTECITPTAEIPLFSYPINWLAIISMMHLMGLPTDLLAHQTQNLTLPDHRLDCFLEWNGIKFYNDSKSTIPHATLAAVDQLAEQPIILFLGGVSKGVDRVPFMAQLPTTIKHIICFGAEADILATAAQSLGKSAHAYPNLELAIESCMTQLSSGDAVLFSPAGASFDLFKDYKERGTHFKKLIMRYTHTA